MAGASSYRIQVATDAGFTNIVASASGLASPTWTSNAALNTNTRHYWRIRAANSCGVGVASSVFSFTTVAALGDCTAGATPNIVFADGFEAGIGGWTSSGTGNTWAISTNASYVHSGAQAMHATNPAAISDQRLVSPPVTLPGAQNPVVLKFWNFQTLEDRTGGCFDGAIVEVSNDSGTTWTQVPNANLLTDPYDGPISSTFLNPLAGQGAWCGDPQPYLNSIVDVSSYAGQTVQFRFRLGNDSSIGRPNGWNIDNVRVQSCRIHQAIPPGRAGWRLEPQRRAPVCECL